MAKFNFEAKSKFSRSLAELFANPKQQVAYPLGQTEIKGV